jgi:hypothetical protein
MINYTQHTCRPNTFLNSTTLSCVSNRSTIEKASGDQGPRQAPADRHVPARTLRYDIIGPKLSQLTHYPHQTNFIFLFPELIHARYYFPYCLW